MCIIAQTFILYTHVSYCIYNLANIETVSYYRHDFNKKHLRFDYILFKYLFIYLITVYIVISADAVQYMTQKVRNTTPVY